MRRRLKILNKVQLGHLSQYLTEDNTWTQTLSVGEQQRLAFARVLICKSKVIFLDEATASMDEGLEDAMYRLIREILPHSMIISVGHRSTLKIHHNQILNLACDGSWEFQ